MFYAVKDNKVYSIDEIEKDSYLAKGFDITDEEGAIIEYNVDKTVSYTEYASLLAEKEKLEKEVVCIQATFEYENADEITSVLSSYSINGVSVSFSDGWNVFIKDGIAMSKDTYALLCQTGLTCRRL